jgi:hypothetical protein
LEKVLSNSAPTLIAGEFTVIGFKPYLPQQLMRRVIFKLIVDVSGPQPVRGGDMILHLAHDIHQFFQVNRDQRRIGIAFWSLSAMRQYCNGSVNGIDIIKQSYFSPAV